MHIVVYNRFQSSIKKFTRLQRVNYFHLFKILLHHFILKVFLKYFEVEDYNDSDTYNEC